MVITELGFGVTIEIKETEHLGKITILDNNLENNIWDRKRQIL